MSFLKSYENIRQALFGIAIFIGGGVAYYTYAKFFSKHKHIYKNVQIEDVSEVKKEIVDLKNSLNCAVADFRRDIERIRKSLSKKKIIPTGRVSALDDICIELDRLNDGTDMDKENALKLCEDQETLRPCNWEILWRLARAHIAVFELRDDPGEKRHHATSALSYAKKSLRYNSNSVDAHKWCAISLGITTDFVSTKEKIQNGWELKEHIDRALIIDPDEPVLHYMNGRWCWGVHKLSWMERKLAAALFATPPVASIDDALNSFQKAENLESGFHKANRFYLAKCYYEKRDYANAKMWCQRALDLPQVTKDDAETHEEAEALLARL